MSNSMIAPRNDLAGWNGAWVLYDYIQNDAVRAEDGSALGPWKTRDEAIGAMECIPQYADYSPQEIMPGNTVPDIFESALTLPDTIIIAGAGPSLSEGLDRVDAEYTIALNSAINYPHPYAHWIAFDHRVVDYPWWNTLRLPDKCKVLFGSRLVNRLRLFPGDAQHAPDHYFSYMPPVDAATRKGEYLRRGYLRGGMNVLGAAMQFGYWFGAKRIMLTGCDQWGTAHWDGFRNPDPYGSHRLHWNTIQRLTDLVKEMAQGGVIVQSLTDTAIAGIERI